ncbi:MAG: TetR/AcrR family transcriptional regulator [Defluviitaleaceae bacterium]|nr:TetR/AcrR family transcriptional regulator [Defluviitaleaceae bacterium]
MPRNKYPEETRKKILDTSLKLFLEKGYDETTVLDIVGRLGGLTRGAFYHHFKSKEEVLDAIFENCFIDRHPVKQALDAEVANGQERLKLALKYGLESNFADEEIGDLSRLAMSLMQQPRFLAEQVKGNQETAAFLEPMVAEGMADGSIKPGNPKLVAELMMLLINFWLLPDIFPCSMEETIEKAEIISQVLNELLGFEIFDDDMEENFMKLADMFGWGDS